MNCEWILPLNILSEIDNSPLSVGSISSKFSHHWFKQRKNRSETIKIDQNSPLFRALSLIPDEFQCQMDFSPVNWADEIAVRSKRFFWDVHSSWATHQHSQLLPDGIYPWFNPSKDCWFGWVVDVTHFLDGLEGGYTLAINKIWNAHAHGQRQTGF